MNSATRQPEREEKDFKDLSLIILKGVRRGKFKAMGEQKLWELPWQNRCIKNVVRRQMLKKGQRELMLR